jgi:hypothetical protein
MVKYPIENGLQCDSSLLPNSGKYASGFRAF